MANLFADSQSHDSCGVGFLTKKSGEQSHEVIELVHQALCKIPHRGGMNAEGVGDGAGVNIDISVSFYRQLCQQDLQAGEFGVGNFFMPISQQQQARELIEAEFNNSALVPILWREVPVDNSVLNAAAVRAQLPILQVVFTGRKASETWDEFERRVNLCLLNIEQRAFSIENNELYPLSLSSRTQVYKGRLNSWEVIPYFVDLLNSEHCVHTLFFHTRFSTNTAPNPWFAQPFRRMAHNGELNTDRKNRLSEDAIAKHNGKRVIFPKGQSDSARLDQTLQRRYLDDNLAIDTAILAMMPPAWENDSNMSAAVLAMLEYFSLYEEKNDGPAALVFGDGVKVGARLDRLGLRPLRSVETAEYLGVMSEAGQINFAADEVIRRGRIEAGGMILFDHATRELLESAEILERMASERDYAALLRAQRVLLSDLPEIALDEFAYKPKLATFALHVGYGLNQESFKFMLDPMLTTGMEKISAMGYGLAPNGLTAAEGGMSRYFSQRFAQVTNPPLDSIREADGMSLRVALGAKPMFTKRHSKQIVLDSPVLKPQQLLQLERAHDSGICRVARLPITYKYCANDLDANTASLAAALSEFGNKLIKLAKSEVDIIIIDDSELDAKRGAIPLLLAVASANQLLIKHGLRFSCSLVVLSGQACSTHEVALALGFGASAICPLSVYNRTLELYSAHGDINQGLKQFQKAVEKALMKTMGKFGLCTVESYIGGEFFEPNFIDTADAKLREIFPNMHSPIGGAGFAEIAKSAFDWHQLMTECHEEKFVPLLGLFKERAEGAGHSFGQMAVRTFVDMTAEPISFVNTDTQSASEFAELSSASIDAHKITPAYNKFCQQLYAERLQRPATLRDIMVLPIDFSAANSAQDFNERVAMFYLESNSNFAVAGLTISQHGQNYRLALAEPNLQRHQFLAAAFAGRFKDALQIVAVAVDYCELNGAVLARLRATAAPIAIAEVMSAHLITKLFASGAMSHGALVAVAHEAVAIGTNMAGALSNSGEGGEHSSRYNSVRSSKIKQFASGRFGVWAGYLADPNLQEIEIKIAQGAKPGEGGQLPAKKVSVAIAAARGGTPGVELVSPPPHHDTYSIEDLGQLIHDAKAARVRVIVKLVSSEGIGTIAVGVAKAGADVINVAACTGGTGAAQVTSLKNTGRIAELGIAEVHQALAQNGLRDKITLRCSNAHQTGLDVVKSALLGADSFEFGTAALMMLKCVMAKNCNVKCPAGLTTNAEVYAGNPRALSQYFINIAHEVRQILAKLGARTLSEIRGRAELLQLIDHPAIVGRIDSSKLLQTTEVVHIAKPIYLEANFASDNKLWQQFSAHLATNSTAAFSIDLGELHNLDKSVGGQFGIDVERYLNYQLDAAHPWVQTLANGRRVLKTGAVNIKTHNSAGQSYALFNNTGINMHHFGTCNDGVAKGMAGGVVAIHNPGGAQALPLSEFLAGNFDDNNVLVGNFALFGATGGELFVQGQAGDRFGVRNSGAVAVVEGVGDFCCEYMTSGSIVNLGGFGKGFGNGMSGGTAYQYDPSHRTKDQVARADVLPIRLDDSEYAELLSGQAAALRYHLERHVAATASAKAAAILQNFAHECSNFYVLLPVALFNHHYPAQIAAKMNRHSMSDELAVAWGEFMLHKLARAYNFDELLFAGKVPQLGERDSRLVCEYIIATGVCYRALAQARKLKPEVIGTKVAELLQTQDFKLQEQLSKDVREVLAHYSDAELAVLLSQKRLYDYKQALALREVADSQALGTSAWIIDRERAIGSALGDLAALWQQLAKFYVELIAQELLAGGQAA